MLRSILTLASCLALAACATAPLPLRGTFSEVTPQAVGDSAARTDSVRWGGVIAAVEPMPEQTCFQIVGTPLRSNGRPVDADETNGRFLACRQGFYDPKIFAEGRELTVVGRLAGSETRKIGEYEYAHPKVLADTIYLWPDERNERDRYPYYRYGYYPYGYYHSYWWWW